MSEKVLDEKLMTRYLLGQLSEEERARVEESFFKDDASFEQLSALEDDLIDDYVRGRLTGDLQNAVQRKLGSDSRWKERVGFARALAQRVSERQSARQPVARADSFFRTLLAAFRTGGQGFQFAVAAGTLVVLIGVVWLASQAIQYRNSSQALQALESERENLEKTVGDLKGQMAGLEQNSQKLSQELERERLARQELEKKGRGAGGPVRLIASFVLRAGLVRGADDAAKLNVPAGASTIRLQLELAPAEDYRTYRAELRTAAGALITGEDMLRAEVRGQSKSLGLDVPAQRLAAGNYELALLGRTDGGQLEEVGYYYFTVE
jgi:hypothetical protein